MEEVNREHQCAFGCGRIASRQYSTTTGYLRVCEEHKPEVFQWIVSYAAFLKGERE